MSGRRFYFRLLMRVQQKEHTTMSLWDSLKVTRRGVTDKLLRLVSEPLLEPPCVDVGDAGGAN